MKKPPKQNAPLAGKGESGKPKKPRAHSNSSEAQRQRLLAWLKKNGRIDTITARRELDILGVAPRIYELRHKFGHAIDMVWTRKPTDGGKLHRVALYVLNPLGEA